MQIREIMTRDVQTVSPGDTIQRAAKLMDDLNVGVLPVCDGTRLVGVITDRDITVRATSVGKVPADCRVEEVMTDEIRYCGEDEDLRDVVQHMSEVQIRRMPVLDRNHRLVGIVSLGDLATDAGPEEAATALERISEPSEPDRGPATPRGL